MRNLSLDFRRCRRLLLNSVAAICSLLAVGPALAQEPVRLLATHFPPYDIEGAKDGNRGFDVDVVEAAFSAVSVKVSVSFSPWSRILKSIETGRVEGMISCADTPERRDLSLLSDPISKASSAFMVRSDYDGRPLSTFADVKGMRVLAVKGYAYVDNLRNAGIDPLLVKSNEAVFRMLAKRRGDVVVVGKENAQYLNKIMKRDQTFRYFEIADLPSLSFHVCFSKARPGSELLKQKFNEGLELIRRSGAYDRIHDKYR